MNSINTLQQGIERKAKQEAKHAKDAVLKKLSDIDVNKVDLTDAKDSWGGALTKSFAVESHDKIVSYSRLVIAEAVYQNTYIAAVSRITKELIEMSDRLGELEYAE